MKLWNEIANLRVVSGDSRRDFHKKIEDMNKEDVKRKAGREVNLKFFK